MPLKGMWSKPMKLKNISTIAMYLHQKQCGASSSLICMSGFLLLSVYNTICPIQQMMMFDDDDDVQEVAAWSTISRTMTTKWFKTNQESEATQSLTFDQSLQQWVWNRKLKRWSMRKRGFAIGCMYYAHPTSGERYYLRMLLNCIKGATSYEHLRTVDGIKHDTFKDACIAMGLLADDNEWHQALEEASLWALGRQLCDMFASMLMFCEVTNPK
jgi:hypothetical protein